MPSTRNSNAGSTIAPGAESVGQAQIVSEFSKPFELEGLFGAADAGAFSGRVEMDDTPMGMVDEDGDVFWDAVEGPGDVVNQMEDVEDGVPMESDTIHFHGLGYPKRGTACAFNGGTRFVDFKSCSMHWPMAFADSKIFHY